MTTVPYMLISKISKPNSTQPKPKTVSRRTTAQAINGIFKNETSDIWRPFEDTLRKTKEFNISQDEVSTFAPTNILEFERLNKSLHRMMQRSNDIYRIRKEKCHVVEMHAQQPNSQCYTSHRAR